MLTSLVVFDYRYVSEWRFAFANVGFDETTRWLPLESSASLTICCDTLRDLLGKGLLMAISMRLGSPKNKKKAKSKHRKHSRISLDFAVPRGSMADILKDYILLYRKKD